MSVRRASASDIDDLVAIHEASFDVPWSAAAFEELLQTTIVLISRKAPQGFVIVRTVTDEAEIITLGVLPAARRSGIAQNLVEQALIEAQKQGCARIFLEVAVDNVGGLSLYAKCGFSQIGVRKAYYKRPQGPFVDAIVMSRAVLIVSAS